MLDDGVAYPVVDSGAPIGPGRALGDFVRRPCRSVPSRCLLLRLSLADTLCSLQFEPTSGSSLLCLLAGRENRAGDHLLRFRRRQVGTALVPSTPPEGGPVQSRSREQACRHRLRARRGRRHSQDCRRPGAHHRGARCRKGVRCWQPDSLPAGDCDEEGPRYVPCYGEDRCHRRRGDCAHRRRHVLEDSTQGGRGDAHGGLAQDTRVAAISPAGPGPAPLTGCAPPRLRWTLPLRLRPMRRAAGRLPVLGRCARWRNAWAAPRAVTERLFPWKACSAG